MIWVTVTARKIPRNIKRERRAASLANLVNPANVASHRLLLLSPALAPPVQALHLIPLAPPAVPLNPTSVVLLQTRPQKLPITLTNYQLYRII